MKPSFLRFTACAATLSELAGGEYLPLPATEGLAFPFLLAFDGCPAAPASFAQKKRLPSRRQAIQMMWPRE